jgi:hypothetical protein
VIEQIDNDVTIKGELHVDADAYFDGHVGIGTTEYPTRNLVVNDSFGNAFIAVRSLDTGLAGILLGNQSSDTPGQVSYSNKSDSMQFLTAASEQMRITSGGRVGIGTDNPGSKLDVSGDVVVGSRNKSWMLVEQGGLCHMVEQVRTLDDVEPYSSEYPKLRDVFNELNLIEKALSDVMDRLRMTPPNGWPVWDGSNETA